MVFEQMFINCFLFKKGVNSYNSHFQPPPIHSSIFTLIYLLICMHTLLKSLNTTHILIVPRLLEIEIPQQNYMWGFSWKMCCIKVKLIAKSPLFFRKQNSPMIQHIKYEEKGCEKLIFIIHKNRHHHHSIMCITSS